MDILTLQITKENFDLILNGGQKTETRYIYPNTAKRYFSNSDKEDEDLEIRKYDALYLINGRKKDSPRLKVEVLDYSIEIKEDEDGNVCTYEENGVVYEVALIVYHLGEVFETENIV